jgi:heptosyltransferase I
MKILLIRISSLGDVLHNMPIVSDLLDHFPNAKIDWVVEEAYVNLVRLQPSVRHVFPVALRRWRKHLLSAKTRAEMRQFYQQLRADEYDLVLETQGLFKTGMLMGMARCTSRGKKVGLANGTEGSGYEGVSRIFHDISVPVAKRTHAVERGRLVAASAGKYRLSTPPNFGLVFVCNTAQYAWLPTEKFVVFFHGTAGQEKRWARQNWIAIASTIAEYQLPVLLPWGNVAEHAEAQAMASHIPNAQVLPALSMQEAIVLAQQASLVVGVDTGLTHIAAAFERPTIEIYCASPRWKTEGNWSEKIINLGDDGAPASVQEVRTSIERLLFNPNRQDGPTKT